MQQLEALHMNIDITVVKVQRPPLHAAFNPSHARACDRACFGHYRMGRGCGSTAWVCCMTARLALTALVLQVSFKEFLHALISFHDDVSLSDIKVLEFGLGELTSDVGAGHACGWGVLWGA